MENDLRIYAKGSAFSGGKYDLRTLEMLIVNYRIILDRLIAVETGRKQVTKDLKKQFSYEVEINPGSVEILLNFLQEHEDLTAALPIIFADGGHALTTSILSLLANAVALRKKAVEFIGKGLTLNINISNSFNIGSKIENTNISFDENTGSIYIDDPRILNAARVTRKPIDSLLSNVDGQRVEYISASNDESEINLTSSDRNIIGQDREILPNSLNIIGRLDIVAFSSHKGSIVSDDQRYSVTWDSSIRSKIQKIADKDGIIFKVMPVVDHKNIEGSFIAFHIIDCEDPQHQMFG